MIWRHRIHRAPFTPHHHKHTRPQTHPFIVNAQQTRHEYIILEKPYQCRHIINAARIFICSSHMLRFALRMLSGQPVVQAMPNTFRHYRTSNQSGHIDFIFVIGTNSDWAGTYTFLEQLICIDACDQAAFGGERMCVNRRCGRAVRARLLVPHEDESNAVKCKSMQRMLCK